VRYSQNQRVRVWIKLVGKALEKTIDKLSGASQPHIASE
jgi:hypothetical protein